MLKCIVWDLDDTLWDGTLRDGVGIVLRKNAVHMVHLADAAGIIQSIASKNDPETAARKLSEFDIGHYFIYPQIDELKSKVDSIRKITERFNIGADTVAFVDNNPFELYEVSRYLPEVSVYNAGDLSALRERAAAMGKDGNTQNRRELMLTRERRLNAAQAFKGSREEFLMECHMCLTVRESRPDDLPRAAELAARANRLNNIRERLDAAEIGAYMTGADKMMYVCELEDIFGSHGIVGTCLMSVSDRLHIDLFCISCRVEGRGVGIAFLSQAIQRSANAKNGLKKAVCAYKPYEKDKSSYLLLKMLGFSIERREPELLIMGMDLPCGGITPSWITILNDRQSAEGVF